MKPVVDTAQLCRKAGMNVSMITGGSTGTYNIDKEIGLTELQAGSYVFMDTLYEKVGGKNDATNYTDFVPSMAVMTTVISANTSISPRLGSATCWANDMPANAGRSNGNEPSASASPAIVAATQRTAAIRTAG